MSHGLSDSDRALAEEGETESTPVQVSQQIDIDEIAASLPRRLHEVVGRALAETPYHLVLIDDAGAWSYRELDIRGREIADLLTSLGVRAGDRLMIVS